MHYARTSLVSQMVKRLPTMRETQVQSLGWEDLLEEAMATHSSILAWRIPWMEEPGGLQVQGVAKSRSRLHFHFQYKLKDPPANAGDIRDAGSIPGLGRSHGVGNGNPPLQYSCLENPMDRGAWRAIVHRVTKESDMT